MTGTLAQLIALTAFGNDYLRNGNIPVDFDSVNSSFQFCNKVDFRERIPEGLTQHDRVVAEYPSKWFQYLKTSGCKHLRLYFQFSDDQSLAKDHQLAGMIGGGGDWLIEAVHPGYSDYWLADWNVTGDRNVSRSIWSVNYRLAGHNLQTSNIQFDIQKTKEKLRQTLTDISVFAFRNKLDTWGQQFDTAKKILDDSSPQARYHRDIIPPANYSLTARQILFAADAAWVFGGMGSWNDLFMGSKEENDQYNELSARLYSDINESFVGGINTF